MGCDVLDHVLPLRLILQFNTQYFDVGFIILTLNRRQISYLRIVEYVDRLHVHGGVVVEFGAEDCFGDWWPPRQLILFQLILFLLHFQLLFHLFHHGLFFKFFKSQSLLLLLLQLLLNFSQLIFFCLILPLNSLYLLNFT